VNLSTPRPEGRGLLEVHPEPRSSTPPPKAGLRAAERVNKSLLVGFESTSNCFDLTPDFDENFTIFGSSGFRQLRSNSASILLNKYTF